MLCLRSVTLSRHTDVACWQLRWLVGVAERATAPRSAHGVLRHPEGAN